MVKVFLKHGRDESLRRFHPWVFSGAVAQVQGSPAEGDIVGVYSAEGQFLASGHWQVGSIAGLLAMPGIVAILIGIVVPVMLFFAFDHIWILFDEHKQAWHDKLAGFYVVKRKARPCGTQRVTQRIINFMMLTFVVWEGAPETHTAATAGAT